MSTTLNSPVDYDWTLDDADKTQTIHLNARLGQVIRLRYLNSIYCIQCGRKTTRSFQQGYCFVCYKRLMDCNLCLLHPERCLYYEGKCHSDDWAHAHCVAPQILYLANTSGLKVGITRAHNTHTRWIDQGAVQGLPLFSAQNRHQIGLLEVIFKKYLADKTHWQTMLKKEPDLLDLKSARDQWVQAAQSEIDKVCQRFPGEIQYLAEAVVTTINYPVLEYPQKIKAFNLDKQSVVEGTLLGIKAQYLILDSGVMSVRKFGGYTVEFL